MILLAYALQLQLMANMQAVWLEKLQWDDLVSENLEKRYLKYRSDVEKLASLTVQRYCGNERSNVRFVSFCDASADAYCAAVYARWLQDGEVKCDLLCVKSRVTLLKSTS